ncbi:inositol monophosphatase family protein [Paenibacillus sp. NPDC058071]|uniref:inositol monophosphatase family protein n=1 Tax=Paenibacillus sp. NPDC058071 TaxID=3346326 RepID=UPI0036D78116
MDISILEKAKAVATEAARKAGHLAKERFDRAAGVEWKDDSGDVVTEVDYLAEKLILDRICEAFPSHSIHSEEAGSIGSGDPDEWLWLIDPLDGTNNYAIGLPLFAVSITLMYHRRPVLGVVYEPMTDRMFVSTEGQGAFCNGIAINTRASDRIERGNVGWIQGHVVQRKDVQALQLRQHIDASFKRMLRLWAPTLLWCMLAKGDLDAIVLYNSEGDDLYSGLLMAKEAGAVVIDFEGQPFEGMKNEPYLIACHPDHREHMLRVVQEGLQKLQ